jgi:hypothetical protein
MKKKYKLLLISFFLTCAVICLTESGMRMTRFEYLCNTALPQNYYVRDDELGFDLAKNYSGGPHEFKGPPEWVTTNSLGCYDRELEAEPYILVLGDDWSFGFAPKGKRWTDLLERKLGIRLLKCAVPQVGTRWEVIKARRIIDSVGRVPLAILVQYGPENVVDDFEFPRHGVANGHAVNVIKSLDLATGQVTRLTPAEILHDANAQAARRSGCKSILYRTLWFQLREWRRQTLVAGLPSSEATVEHMATIRDGDLISGYFLALAAYHFNFWNYEYPERPWYQEALSNHLRDLHDLFSLGKKTGAPIIVFDPFQVFKHELAKDLVHFLDTEREMGRLFIFEFPQMSNDEFWPYDIGWNEKGNAHAANIIFDFLNKNNLSKLNGKK